MTWPWRNTTSTEDHSPSGWLSGLIESKKTLSVLVVVLAGIIIGLVINFVNLHTDFQDLQDFHRGYMGRKLLIKEGKLTSREYLKAINKVQKEEKVNQKIWLKFTT